MNIDDLVAAFSGGMSVTMLHLRTGQSKSMVKRRLIQAGVDIAAKPHINDTRSRDVRMLKDSRPQREIARQVGCTIATIRKVKAAMKEGAS